MSGEIALVIGGTGCVGYHIVKALLTHPSFASIHVFSRNPKENLLDGVEYHSGSISSEEDIKTLFATVKPTVVFNSASPLSSGSIASSQTFHDVNVLGTQRLLKYATSTPSTKIYIYTSSAAIAKPPLRLAKEDGPLKTVHRRGFSYYMTSKVLSDTAVRQANKRGFLRTCTLRVPIIYGERDHQFIPGLLQALKDKQQKIQIGRGNPLADFLSATNAARAHVLAYEAIIKGMEDESVPKVDGEAFNITDGKPLPFWESCSRVWGEAGDITKEEEIWHVPAWLVITFAAIGEALVWTLTLGRKLPNVRSSTVKVISNEATFSIEKARERLRYEPMDDWEQGIKDGVAWALSGDKSGKKTT